MGKWKNEERRPRSTTNDNNNRDNKGTNGYACQPLLPPGTDQQGPTHPNAGQRDERAEEDGVRADKQEQDRGRDERVAGGGVRRTCFAPGSATRDGSAGVLGGVRSWAGQVVDETHWWRESGLTNQLGWDLWV